MAKEGKLARDTRTVDAILAKGVENLTHEDRLALLQVYNVAWHDTGKIEGIFSFDSSCNGCNFCAMMRKAAEKDSSIICGHCYDAKQEVYRISMKERHMLNLRIMSTVEFTVEELSTLNGNGAINRVNSSGDIENETHARNMVKIGYAHPISRVTIWAKNVPAVQKAFDELGKPENVIFIASSIRINGCRNLPKYADYTFTVYDKEHIAAAMEKGACECNGKKCRECGFKCYYGTWEKGSDIAELLR